MPLAGPKLFTIRVKGGTKIIHVIGRIRGNLSRASRRTGRSLAEKGREQAKEIVRMQEAQFPWSGKGQLMNSIVVREGEQGPDRNEFQLVAGASYAAQVEEGLTPRKVPVANDTKLQSWLKGAGFSRFPKFVTVSAKDPYPARPIPWGTEGMQFMRKAFDFMRKDVETYVEQLAREIY